jgi:hypothetical protein
MSLDLQLSDLRRALDVATTKIDGQLAVLLQRSDYAEQRAREQSERFTADITAVNLRIDAQDKRTDGLDRKVYFMAGVAATIGSGVGVLATVVSHGR